MANREYKRCDTCLFFDESLDLTDEDAWLPDPRGHCRYDVPHPKHGWPRVHCLDWCGQWQAYSELLRTYMPEAEA